MYVHTQPLLWGFFPGWSDLTACTDAALQPSTLKNTTAFTDEGQEKASISTHRFGALKQLISPDVDVHCYMKYLFNFTLFLPSIPLPNLVLKRISYLNISCLCCYETYSCIPPQMVRTEQTQPQFPAPSLPCSAHTHSHQVVTTLCLFPCLSSLWMTWAEWQAVTLN